MTVDSGIPGLTLEPGGHVCGVFRAPEERDGAMAAFFRAGLLAGDRSVVVVDAADAGAVLSRVGSPSEIADWRRTGLLDVRSSAVPSRSRKDPTPDGMPGVWGEIVDPAWPAGIRLGAEASCWLPRAGPDSLIRYENEVARYIPEQLVVLCLYDLNRFGAGVLIDAIRMHPQV
ncbi:hypothetical protein HF519_15960, partial [Pseudonocardia bannensis]